MDFKRFVRSFKYAFRGVAEVTKTEQNLKIFWVVAILNIIIALVLKLTAIEWVIGISITCIAFSLEILNTALEELLDMISPEYNGRVKTIKDMVAGAALAWAVGAIIVAFVIYIPHILSL